APKTLDPVGEFLGQRIGGIGSVSRTAPPVRVVRLSDRSRTAPPVRAVRLSDRSRTAPPVRAVWLSDRSRTAPPVRAVWLRFRRAEPSVDNLVFAFDVTGLNFASHLCYLFGNTMFHLQCRWQ